MKRQGYLWEQITGFENILTAARLAQKGKRFRQNVLEFNYNLEQELHQLQEELRSKTYQPGDYRTFKIFEPKPRLISAAPYRDRVVHHALCNIIVPIFEQTFIADSYANRLGFGTHRALRRFTQFARSSRYVLQCDIRKYFPSLDHEILKQLIRRKIKCPDTLWLIETIIDRSNEQEPAIAYFPGDDLPQPFSNECTTPVNSVSPLNSPILGDFGSCSSQNWGVRGAKTAVTPALRRRGLPIGNLTSQFFANIYLNGFDHFVKEQLRVNRYLRYVDDFALFSDERSFLVEARSAIEDYLTGLRLIIHPIKSQLFETRIGANFVGFRVLPDRIRVRSDNLRRARYRIRQLRTGVAAGNIDGLRVTQSLQSWEAHLKHGDTWRLRQQIFSDLAEGSATVQPRPNDRGQER
ncbi:reverse transcriptase domain-containing protein [Pantanalinema rosaneae CENA516]|uniref:reverse transcriptase domain-containing protein n=1 Tax=Pantanalinema rosaneae TaxID=1620701 RepID=UPI003D6F695C